MLRHLLSFTLTFLTGLLPLFAGDAKTRLKELQTRVANKDFQDDKLRRDLLAFAREHVGTPQYGPAMDALRATPSPFDKLDAKAIDAEARKILSIGALVAYLRPHDRAVARVEISIDG